MSPSAGSLNFTYKPGLDGIRAFAVVLVLLNHLAFPFGTVPIFHGATQIGVDIFFVLSGFLITRLLLAENNRAGRVSLKDFWGRRAIRLLPLSLVVIGCVAAADAIFDDAFYSDGQGASHLRAIIAALGYHMNILQSGSGHHVWALTHTWSLSLEEQFYVIWPIIVFGCCVQRRVSAPRAIVLASAMVVLASAVLRVVLTAEGPSTGNFIYNSLATRSGQLCAGALLAGVSVARADWTRQLGKFAWWGFVALFALSVRDVLGSRAYGLDFDVISVCAVVMIAGAVNEGSLFARAASVASLRWLGTRSYALYLIHYPVFLALTPSKLPWASDATLMLIRLVVALSLTELAHRLIERPFLKLRHHFDHSTRAAVATP